MSDLSFGSVTYCSSKDLAIVISLSQASQHVEKSHFIKHCNLATQAIAAVSILKILSPKVSF